MEVKSMLWMTFFSACLLGATVDSVLLSQYEKWRRTKDRVRVNYETSRSDRVEKAKIQKPRRAARNFVPTGHRCCKVGEKAAKKRLYCSSIKIYAAAKTFNNKVRKTKVIVKPRIMKKYAKVLFAKVNKCSVDFSKNFEKCCRMKSEYYRHMKKCRWLKKSERKRCRESIKRRYRS